MIILAGEVRGQETDELRVDVQVLGGSPFVGQTFEVRVGVVGTVRRPELDQPSVAGADIWLIEHGSRRISASGIGPVMAETNLFVSRFGMVARRAGVLEIPSIRARLGARIGRSRPVRVTVRPVPATGRPAEFLGGVGEFSVRAAAAPQVVRVGQELELRITVRGSAAPGMTDRPELKRFDRLGIGLRIEPKPVETINEPPSRTFVYRLRPTRPRDVVLPPVAIAAFEPSTMHYVTHVSPGVPIRVVAVPAFDPASIPKLASAEEFVAYRSRAILWGVGGGSGVLLLSAAAGIAWVRRRARLVGRWGGPAAARRFAARLARDLAERQSPRSTDFPPLLDSGSRDGNPAHANGLELALMVSSGLVRYLQIGIGRPPGALTPDEAGDGVERCSGSEELGIQAARLAARCDGLLYRDAPAPPEPDHDPERLKEDARSFFARLGRSRSSVEGTESAG